MTQAQQKAAAKDFARYWQGKGYEKGQSQPFWLALLRDVYGVEHPEQFISFEEQVHLDHTSFIDGHIPATKVLIEQKGADKDLKKPIKQSDGTLLTPFQQAKRYITELPVSQHPRWVVTCNFAEFYVYDMEQPNGEPQVIKLAELPTDYYRLQFLVDTGSEQLKREMEVSIRAGDIVGLLYNAFLKQYADPTSEATLRSLNVLCVRLVFCLYAEDAGIFGRHGMFHDYMAEFKTHEMRKGLVELFRVLDQDPKKGERDPYLKDDNPALAAFPYVNGNLFKDESIEIPPFTEELRDLLLTKACGFNWQDISPTIFGGVFESTLNPETRRKGGMHYTSIENIHKVIDPLFLDDLKAEFSEITAITVDRTRAKRLQEFQNKLAGLVFLDPACGSGNFLTETYLSLRRLENKVINEIHYGQTMLGDDNELNPIKVSISQFYGIEINDFAVSVARTALWIAESQMMQETSEMIHRDLDFLPLKTNAYIKEGNALRMDWESVVPQNRLNYIMGNPPFVGYKLQNEEQKKDLFPLYGDTKNIDYVAGWYYKASSMLANNTIRAAFVSTNSVTQGEQVASVWKILYEKYGIHIDFAHRSFVWDNEANMKAQVHCVIVGFSSAKNEKPKKLYSGSQEKIVDNINPYLVPAETVFIEKRSRPIMPVEVMTYGSEPREGGFLILSEEERKELIEETPQIEEYIHRFVSSEDFINNKIRYCLWGLETNLHIVKKSEIIMKRLENCRKFRENSKQKQAHDAAVTPYLFASIRQPKTDYLLVPIVSSENRRYIPIGYMSKDIIASNACFTIENASLYTFGILESNVHMAWMRAVCGRLKSDYRYSNTIVYNNFIWPNTPPPPYAHDSMKAKIEQTAQAILDARALYLNSSLADLYDDLTMPPELRKAHQNNDRAVMQAYGMSVKDTTESSCVAELMRLYQQKTAASAK